MLHPLDVEEAERAGQAVDFADRIADRWSRLYPRYADEIRSAAGMGAMEAAQSFDPDRDGAVWRKWLSICVRNQIHRFMRSSYRKHAPLTDSQCTLNDLEDTWSDQSAAQEAQGVATALLERLPPRHRALCDLVYGEGLSAHQAGIKLGWTGDHGCRVHRESLAMLREHYHAA